MNKRLRKKLHKGEFRQYGFEFSFEFDPPLGEEEFGSFFDRLLEMLDSYDLGMGGGGDTKGISGSVGKYKGSVTLEEIEMVRGWLLGCTEVKNIWVGELMDMWN